MATLSWPGAVELARRLTSAGPVRVLVELPGIEHLAALAARSTVVVESGRFAARELLRARRPVAYRLRGSGLRVVIRHGTPDIVTLDEVFFARSYELPPEVSLGAAPRVVDLGANIGLFGVFMLEHDPGARIVAVEPDSANVEILRRCIAANPDLGDWELVEAVASTQEGNVAFVSGRHSLSHIAGPDETGVQVPAIDIFPLLEDADLLKMDIEGGEWPILRDPRLAATTVRALVLEYHAFSCPEPNPRVAATAALTRAGFEVQPAGGTDDYGVVWALRPVPTASSSSTGTSPTNG